MLPRNVGLRLPMTQSRNSEERIRQRLPAKV